MERERDTHTGRHTDRETIRQTLINTNEEELNSKLGKKCLCVNARLSKSCTYSIGANNLQICYTKCASKCLCVYRMDLRMCVCVRACLSHPVLRDSSNVSST